MFEIEQSVPLPTGRSKYPFLSMALDESFFVPLGDRKKKLLVTAVRQASKRISKVTGMRFLVRCVDDGVRVWRVE